MPNTDPTDNMRAALAKDGLPVLGEKDYRPTDSESWAPKPPRRKAVLLDMTENMQTALIHCASRGVTEDEFGPGKRWSTITRDALVKHELIHLMRTRKGYKLWRPTDRGRGLVAAHVPSLLAARPDRVGKDYTHKPSEAMRHEPESLDNAA